MIKLLRPLSFALMGFSLATMAGCFVVAAEDSGGDDDGGGDIGDSCESLDDCKNGLVCTAGSCAIREGGTGGTGGVGGTGGSATGGSATGGSATGGSGGMKEVGEPCTEADECVPGSVCFNEFCVGTGVMRVSLAFSADSDFDLHVLTPDNIEIYFGNASAGGGELDVDQCVGSCASGAHVENVVFDVATSGVYETWVENYDGRSSGAFTIEVAGAVTRTFMGSLTATASEESEHFTFTR